MQCAGSRRPCAGRGASIRYVVMGAMTRLESLSPDLAAKMQRASVTQRRAACVAACELAISHARVEHPRVEHAMQKLRAGGVFGPKERAELDALAAMLDEKYFALQDAAE